MRALADTNILPDVFLQREEFLPEAMDIWIANEQKLFEGYVSALTPVNVYYIARRTLGDKEIARSLAARILSLFQICALTETELQSALSLPFSDYEDAVQAASASAEDLDAIITRNKADFQNSDIPVYSPAAFLELL